MRRYPYIDTSRKKKYKSLREERDYKVAKFGCGEAWRRIRSNHRIPKQLRQLIYERYNSKCYICDTTENLKIHHLNEDGFDHDEDNLVLLCIKCHGNIHTHYD